MVMSGDIDRNTRRFYKEEASIYDTTRGTSVVGRSLWQVQGKTLLELCGDIRNITILDLGAGTGRFSIELANKGANVVSFDQATEMLNVIKEKTSKLDITLAMVRGDGCQVPFKDCSFDGIICIQVLGHLPTYMNVLREMSRVLKEDGFIIVSFPNIKSCYLPAALYVNFTHRAIGSNVHSYFFTKREIDRAIKDSGFVVSDVRGSNLLKYPQFLPQEICRLVVKLEEWAASSFLRSFSGSLFIKARLTLDKKLGKSVSGKNNDS